MKKINIKTITSILCIFVLSLLIFSPYSQAKSSLEGNNLWEEGKQFIQNGSGQKKQLDPTTLMPIGRILVTIATVVLTVVTIVMAIKYMMCDSADKKAKLKTQLIGLVVATVVIYGGQFIWATIYSFMTDVTGGVK